MKTNTNTTLNITSIRPFAVVTAPYTDLTGQVKTFKEGQVQRGLFLVAHVSDTNHVLAFKITSQNKFLGEFTYVLPQSKHPFLRADSYVQFDRWHTLNIDNCIIVGMVNPTYRIAFLRKWDLISREVDKALKDNISLVNPTTSYVSPNKYKTRNFENNYRPYKYNYNRKY